jgi:hypothetical protein
MGRAIAGGFVLLALVSQGLVEPAAAPEQQTLPGAKEPTEADLETVFRRTREALRASPEFHAGQAESHFGLGETARSSGRPNRDSRGVSSRNPVKT